MQTNSTHVLSQAHNGNNGSLDYEAMVKGLISLCDDSELVICLDRNGVVKHIKKTARNGALHKGAELVGKNILHLLSPETENMKAVFLKVMETGKAIRCEDVRDGRWFDSMVYPIVDKRGRIEHVLVMGRDITRSKQAEKEIRRLNGQLEQLVARRTAELEDRANKLEELNCAFRVLLQKRDEDKVEREQHMMSGINQLIIPCVRQIKQKSKDPEILSCIDLIETNLKHFTVSFGPAIQSKAFGLTPTEIEVATLIKAGKASKDIGKAINISSKTVDFHRRNIRHKLGIRNEKQNLRSFLIALGR